MIDKSTISKIKDFPVGTYFSMRNFHNQYEVFYGTIGGIHLRNDGKLTFLATMADGSMRIGLDPEVVEPIDYPWEQINEWKREALNSRLKLKDA